MIGGIPAVILGLLAILFGILARKKGRGGVSAIVLGVIAIIVAVSLTMAGINHARSSKELLKNHPELAPTIASHYDEINTDYGYLGFVKGAKNEEELKVMTDELKVLLEKSKQEDTKATSAPAAVTEAPAEEAAD